MRIGIDARFYNKQTRGISRVIREFLTHLINMDKKNTYVVFLLQGDVKNFEHKAKNIEIFVSRSKYYSLEEHFIFPKEIKQAKVQFMHFLNFNAPYNCPVPYIVTIHDLTLFFYPGRKKKSIIHKLVYKTVMGRAVRKAKFVHAITNHTKQDIMQIFHIPKDKIKVIYEGVNDNFRPIKSQKLIQKVLDKYAVKKPYFIYHGAWRKHKNIVNLIKAFDKFSILNKSQNFKLVIAGKIDLEYPEIPEVVKDLNIEDRVIFLDKFISDKELASLFSACTSYVFPSLYEGFGLTPLEAMSCGAPVLSSDASCMPEVLGEAAYYFDPNNIEDITTAMNRIATNSRLQNDFSLRSLKQIKHYSWQSMTSGILELYKLV
ncbi:glycosyltransferase family 4 protein [Patescibacteria group bacterium]